MYSRLTLALCAAVTAASTALAQSPVRLNEIYASHAGTDDREFIELIGPAGYPLTGHVVLVVEGEGAGTGTLDRVWDLSGLAIPPAGYFVLGDTAVVPNHFDIGASNSIENGTETFYLVETTDPAALAALLGTNVSNGPATTVIPSMSTVLDLVAMVDPDWPATDVVYDGAVVIGPDGTFFPAGIYRGGDAPGLWCGSSYLDFDPAVNTTEPTTPGALNGACRQRAFIFAGLEHSTLGTAAARKGGGGLVVSNIGSMGLDGVRIVLGASSHGVSVLGELDPAFVSVGATMTVTTTGQVAGVPDQVVRELHATVLPTGMVEATVDGSGSGVTSWQLRALRDGVVVAEQTAVSAPSIQYVPGRNCSMCVVGGGGGKIIQVGRAASAIEFPDGPTLVMFPGLPAVMADVIVAVPDPGAPVVDFVSSETYRATGLDSFTIKAEGLRQFGRSHYALGDANMEARNGQLVVSNIGSMGLDGVRIDLGAVPAFDVDWDELDPTGSLPLGATLVISAEGQVSTVPGMPLGTLELRRTVAGIEATPDFTVAGTSTHIVEVYDAGNLVISVPGHTGVAAFFDIWPTGCSKRRLWPPWGTDCFAPRWPHAVSITIPGVAGGPFMGDELRVLAENAAGTLDWLEKFELRLTDIPEMTLVSEASPNNGLGTPYCTATANSTGVPAELDIAGSLYVADDDITLNVTNVPAGRFGYCLGSRNQGFFMPPGSQGNICLGNPIARFRNPGQVFVGPVGSVRIHLNNIPLSPPTAVMPGETWNFQAWHRDAGNTSNFTRGHVTLMK